MKLIIEIDEEEYQNIVDNVEYIPSHAFTAIRNGIPLEQIRAEIEKVFCMSVVTNELRTPMEVKTEILQIIDKYR